MESVYTCRVTELRDCRKGSVHFLPFLSEDWGERGEGRGGGGEGDNHIVIHVRIYMYVHVYTYMY